ncbi:MAG: hypothetical protein ACE5KM_18280, partial [Planctomycetaceae bacterium]
MQFHLLLAFGIASVAGTPLVAADKPPQREVPLFVANLAGADRLLKDSDRLFRLIERRDLGLALKATIALSTSGLKGVDRKRPLGLMTLIDPGEAPEPVGVVYVPIANAKDFLEALAALRVDVKPAGNGYALKWNGESYAMRIQQRYAFLARRMKSLKRKFGDPAVDFAALSNAYDAAIRIQLDAVPKELRWMILDYARASAAIGLQRRPGESVVDHRLRKSLGMLALAGMAELLRDGRSLTIGVALKKPRTSAVLEMRMAAKRDSALSRGLADLAPQAGKRRPSKPASSHLVVNWKPPTSLRPVADSLLGAMPQGNRRDAKAAARIWTTVRDGWFDSGILVSIRSADKSPAVVVRVGMPAKRKNGDRLRRLLGDLQRAGAIRKLKPNAVRNRRGVFHRFEWNGGPADWTLSGLTAASNDSLWLAV